MGCTGNLLQDIEFCILQLAVGDQFQMAFAFIEENFSATFTGRAGGELPMSNRFPQGSRNEFRFIGDLLQE